MKKLTAAQDLAFLQRLFAKAQVIQSELRNGVHLKSIINREWHAHYNNPDLVVDPMKYIQETLLKTYRKVKNHYSQTGVEAPAGCLQVKGDPNLYAALTQYLEYFRPKGCSSIAQFVRTTSGCQTNYSDGQRRNSSERNQSVDACDTPPNDSSHFGVVYQRRSRSVAVARATNVDYPSFFRTTSHDTSVEHDAAAMQDISQRPSFYFGTNEPSSVGPMPLLMQEQCPASTASHAAVQERGGNWAGEDRVQRPLSNHDESQEDWMSAFISTFSDSGGPLPEQAASSVNGETPSGTAGNDDRREHGRELDALPPTTDTGLSCSRGLEQQRQGRPSGNANLRNTPPPHPLVDQSGLSPRRQNLHRSVPLPSAGTASRDLTRSSCSSQQQQDQGAHMQLQHPHFQQQPQAHALLPTDVGHHRSVPSQSAFPSKFSSRQIENHRDARCYFCNGSGQAAGEHIRVLTMFQTFLLDLCHVTNPSQKRSLQKELIVLLAEVEDGSFPNAKRPFFGSVPCPMCPFFSQLGDDFFLKAFIGLYDGLILLGDAAFYEFRTKAQAAVVQAVQSG